jgi:mono/diheme cytochrome c family protein
MQKLVRTCLLSLLSAILLFPLGGFSSAHAANPDGERLYADYCSSCHGEELRNTSGGGTFDLRRLKSGDHERFISVVLNGKNQMPPWRGALEPDQIEAIWTYVRATLDYRR